MHAVRAATYDRWRHVAGGAPGGGAGGLPACGCPLALINRDETPYDGLAALVIRENIAQVLDEAVRLCLEQA